MRHSLVTAFAIAAFSLGGASAHGIAMLARAVNAIGAGMLLGAVAAQDDTVPFADLFPDGTPDDFISMNVTFDQDTADAGGADTSSDFPDDGQEEDEPFGVLFLDSPNAAAMADLSETSGWVLAACDPASLGRQTVFAFCAQDPATSSSCAQVFTGGAEHTIVKMPRGCGKGPLARVHSLAVHSGLAPAELAKLKKPASAPLYQLVFDYDFAAIPADNGPVFMRADVSDMPGYWDEIVDSPTDPDDNVKRRGIGARRRERVAKRGFFSKLKSWAAKVTKVSQSKTDKRKFELQNSFTIFNQTKDCGVVSASLQASVTARAAFNTQYGLALITGY